VAHSASAKKRIRQNVKSRGHNRWRKDQVKVALKGLELAIHDGKADDAQAKLKTLYRTLDKVSVKRTIHPNAASRKKSRMAKAINKMVAAKAAPAAPTA